MTACASTEQPGGERGGVVDAALVGPGGDEMDVNGKPPDIQLLDAGGGGKAEFAARSADGVTDASHRLVVEHVDPPAAGQAGAWTIRQRLVKGEGDEGEAVRVQHVRRLADGSIVLEREENMVEQVEVVFEPPMVVVPGTLGVGGDEHTQSFTMTVHPLEDRQRVKARGGATNTISIRGDGERGPRVRLADDRSRAAWRLVSELHAELGPADVRNVTVQWFGALDDERGGVVLLAERREEKTSVLGIPTRHSIERWVRIMPEK